MDEMVLIVPPEAITFTKEFHALCSKHNVTAMVAGMIMINGKKSYFGEYDMEGNAEDLAEIALRAETILIRLKCTIMEALEKSEDE